MKTKSINHAKGHKQYNRNILDAGNFFFFFFFLYTNWTHQDWKDGWKPAGGSNAK